MRYLFLAAKVAFVVALAWSADRDARNAREDAARCTEFGFVRESVDFTLCRLEMVDRRRNPQDID